MSGRRFYLNIKHKLRSALNPALCQLCGIPVDATAMLCTHCFNSLSQVPNPCTRCGQPNPASGDICPSCRLNPPRWQRMIAPLTFSGATRDLILQFKFAQQRPQARILLTHLLDKYRQHTPDVLIPVPLHPQKRLQRGYNQAQEVAAVLSDSLFIPLDTRSLRRVKLTGSQAGLSLHKRRKNLRAAFTYQPVRRYRSVAIIDDIITSGSTMDEICKVIQKAGVRHIEAWSLARTLKH